MELGRDNGHPGQALNLIRLGELTPVQVDMRTMMIIGLPTLCTVQRAFSHKCVRPCVDIDKNAN